MSDQHPHIEIITQSGERLVITHAESVLINRETSLSEKLTHIGVKPATLIAYLKEKLAEDRSTLEVKKDLLSKIDYYKESCRLNDIEILILSLEKNL
jgi:hypothetical protein